MRAKTSKALVDSLADFSWFVLEDLFGHAGLRPPVYFFEAPWADGSLKNRSFREIELVHRQQFKGEGVTLISPPAAWVSDLRQIPEEVGHLYAILKKKAKAPRKPRSLESEFEFLAVHETFGHFAAALVLGPRHQKSPLKSLKLSDETLWELAHRKGYLSAVQLSHRFFLDSISLKALRSWFALDWSNHPHKAYQTAQRLASVTERSGSKYC